MKIHGQARADGTMIKMMSLVLCSLFLMNLGAVGVQGDEGQGTQDAAVSLVSFDISGRAEGGFAEVMDIRELYNQGGRTAVSYLISLNPDMNITELDISSGETQYSYEETPRERTDEEVLDGEDVVFMRYLDEEDAGTLINGMVEQYSDPALFAFSGNRLLVCQFPMDAFSFLSTSVRYGYPLAEEGGLTGIDIPLASNAVIGGSALDHASGLEGTVTMGITSMSTLEGIYSPTHDIMVTKNGYQSATFSWTGEVNTGDTMTVYFSELDRAFGGGFLNYRLPGKTMFQENEDGYFMFLFNPNTEELEEQAMSKDVVFIIDTSGSMSGEKMTQAIAALKQVLDILSHDDRFTILRFSDSVSSFNGELVNADPANIETAKDWVGSLRPGGGTNINQALLESLGILDDYREAGRPREIIFLTDGQATSGVTNNQDILRNVKSKNVEHEIESTLHVFGIGYQVNTLLLDTLSSETGGSTIYIEPDQDIDEVLTPFYRTIASPVLTDISIEITGISTMMRYPETIPDLHRGGELNIVGIYQLDTSAPLPERVDVFVNGTTTSGNTSYEFSFPMEGTGSHDFLPRIYATRAVGALLQDIKQDGETPEKVAMVERYGKRYGIETPYTSLTIHTNAEFDSEGFRTLTGKASVQASNLISSYSSTRIAGKGLVQNARAVGDRTFINLDGVYIQSDLLPDDEIIELDNESLEEWINENISIDRFVKFASTGYFSLASDREVMDILTLGPEIVFSTGTETIGVTRGNLLLYIKNLRAVTWDQSLSIGWETNVPASSVVHYREAGENGTGQWNVLRGTGLTTDHNITMTVPYETYEFFIESTDAQGNTAIKDNNGEYYLSYHFPLAIIAVKANIGYAIMDGQEVVIRWYTNVAADGKLIVRVEGGEWEVVSETSNTKEHEGTFTASAWLSDSEVVKYDFYVTASLGKYEVVEDNNGDYFSFDCVGYSCSSPSFHAGTGMMILSILFVVFLATVFNSKQSGKQSGKQHIKGPDGKANAGTGEDGVSKDPIGGEGGTGVGPENASDDAHDNVDDSDGSVRTTGKHRMLGILAGNENASFGKHGDHGKGA